MTTGILNSINTKDELYRTLLKQALTPMITGLQRPILRDILPNIIKGPKCCTIREHLTFIKMM